VANTTNATMHGIAAWVQAAQVVLVSVAAAQEWD
jgi:hypothetical protein